VRKKKRIEEKKKTNTGRRGGSTKENTLKGMVVSKKIIKSAKVESKVRE